MKRLVKRAIPDLAMKVEPQRELSLKRGMLKLKKGKLKLKLANIK